MRLASYPRNPTTIKAIGKARPPAEIAQEQLSHDLL
jgi:hypothetical protein